MGLPIGRSETYQCGQPGEPMWNDSDGHGERLPIPYCDECGKRINGSIHEVKGQKVCAGCFVKDEE